MKIGDLFEGVVSRRGNKLQVGSLELQLYPDHIFYVVGGGKDADLSIYKDGAFKPPRNNEIYLKDAASRGVPQAFINLFSKFFATQDIDVVVNGLEALFKSHVKEGNKENKEKKKQVISPKDRPKMKMSDFDPRTDLKKKVAEDLKPLSVQQLATISDEALDKAYGYGRSTPGNSFGWQANLKSAEFAKRMIDKGITDIEKISDAIHQGWNVTAKAFVQNPNQFDDTAKLQAAGKLEAKLQQREKLMKIGYSQLPDDEKEKDRVVARALLAAITGEQGIAEGPRGMGVAARDWAQNKKSQASRRGDAGWSKPYRQPGEPSKADLSAMAAKAKADYDKKKGIREEEDHEASMARGQLMSACKNAMALIKMIQEGDNLEGWVAAKITKASDYLTMVHDYMAYEEVSEEKQRLDPKCWKGYRKAGTKMKGGVRVNNCVKVKK